MIRSPFPPRALGGAKRPTFSLFKSGSLPGVANLPSALTINSLTVNPTVRYKAGDAGAATWAAWDYGETLTLQAGTAPTLNQGSPLLGTADDSVKFNSGGYYQGSTTAVGDIALEDFVVECVFRMPATQPVTLFGHRSGAVPGWRVTTTTATRLICTIGSGATQVSAGLTGTLSAGSWYHLIVFLDRSGSSISYVNGVAQSAVDISSLAAASLTTADVFTVGASAGGANLLDNPVAYLAMWKQANWLDSHLQGTIALSRFNALIGLTPQVAKGTSTPVAQTRATTAHLYKQEGTARKLYSVGAGWIRSASRKDSADTLFSGLLIEPASTNLILQSEVLGTTWGKIDAGDTIGGSVVVPNKATITTGGIIADSTDGQHGVTQDVTLTAVTHTFSCFAKKGNKDWLFLANTTVANCSAYFDLNTGVVGTVGAGAVGYIHDWGDGWYRCYLTFLGTVAAHTLQVSPAHADTDNTFAGDGATVNTSVWGVQCATGGRATSYVPTTTATVTRNADVLYYKADDGNIGGVGSNLRGSLECKILYTDYDAIQDMFIFSLNDGGAAADDINAAVLAAGDAVDVNMRATAGNNGDTTGTTDVTDDVINKVSVSWAVNNLKLKTKGALDGTPDTDCGVPNDLDRLYIGSDRTGANQLRGLITDIRVFKK